MFDFFFPFIFTRFVKILTVWKSHYQPEALVPF